MLAARQLLASLVFHPAHTPKSMLSLSARCRFRVCVCDSVCGTVCDSVCTVCISACVCVCDSICVWQSVISVCLVYACVFVWLCVYLCVSVCVTVYLWVTVCDCVCMWYVGVYGTMSNFPKRATDKEILGKTKKKWTPQNHTCHTLFRALGSVSVNRPSSPLPLPAGHFWHCV